MSIPSTKTVIISFLIASITVSVAVLYTNAGKFTALYYVGRILSTLGTFQFFVIALWRIIGGVINGELDKKRPK
ncbi:hypothetical protein FHW36_11817 [Chitinophaga polysaccharea]|uniref:Uncharacterized protein n=1 Tax=Chitinophaga polysaccharea TaxID=1293035 RepID=A0A561P0R7_9BACT|nr:hypothetical protein [Chitinophaga polysaccharea]TWF31723.1 hypothetical protein FHW36_11817 [Chitinophaga polysaccharea]